MVAKKERVLVTGGAGLVGSVIVGELLLRGRQVLCLDTRLPERQHLPIGEHEALEALVGDVRDGAQVDALVARCDRVVHLAAVVGIDEYLRDPLEVLDVGILGTRNVLTSCLRHGRPVLFSSTSEIYGKNVGELSERSDALIGPPEVRRFCYASSKIAAEHYAFALASAGLRVTVVRYFNVYGPQLERPGSRRVISKFVAAIQAGEPLFLVGGGQAVRSFCYVADAANATVELALRLGEQPEVAGRAFNIGRREPVTIRALAERMIALSGHEAGLEEIEGESFFGPGFQEIPKRIPDVTAIREVIGWEAKTSLDEGLALTLRHFGLSRAS